jgi:hypothetical protein
MALPVNRSFDEIVVQARMADVATTTSCWAVAPCKGVVKRMFSVIEGTVNGDAVISLAIDGATALTETLTIADTSTAGTVDSVTYGQGPTYTGVTEGSKIDIDSDGGGSTTVVGNFFIVIERT